MHGPRRRSAGVRRKENSAGVEVSGSLFGRRVARRRFPKVLQMAVCAASSSSSRVFILRVSTKVPLPFTPVRCLQPAFPFVGRSAFGPFGPSRATAATLSLLGRRRLMRLAAVVAPCTLQFVLLQGGQSGHGGRRVPQPSSQARPAAETRRALSVVGRPCRRAGGVWRPAWWRAGGRTSGVPRAAAVPLLQPNCPPLDYYSHGTDGAGLLLWGLRLGTYQSIAYIHTHDTANTNHQQPTTNHVQAPPRPPGRPGRRRRVLRPSRAQGGPYEGSETLDVSWARPAIDSLPKSPPTVQSLAT